MNAGCHVMVVDDELAMRESLAGWLEKESYAVTCAADGGQALELMRQARHDLLLVDIKMPGMDGLELLQKIKTDYPETMVVIITAYGSIESAVQAMKQGAEDYLLKPFDPELLMMLMRKLVERQSLLKENLSLKERLREHERTGWGDLVADSPAMRAVLDMVMEVAASDSPVLITGETGAGKEMVARALHTAGQRAHGPFVPLNCGGQSESLLESELFGHEKGAFTGAVKTRRGRLEIADGGSLFLDEVGEISAKMQVDLLRVLEEKTFTRLGGSQTVKSDFRLISATHRDLAAMVRSGDFRQDFFYRINVISVHVPPLRERPEDIGLLAHYFLKRYARETGKQVAEISPEALALLAGYSWPGNVRELKNVMERAVVIARQPVVGKKDLTFLEPGGGGGAEMLSLKEMERRHIQRVLDAQQGNLTRTAKVLGIDRRTLSRKLQRQAPKAE
jgi:DNA-binding NtrC family response regulator